MEREKLSALSAQVQSDLSRAMKSVASSSSSAPFTPTPGHSHVSERFESHHGGVSHSSSEDSLRSRLMFMNFTGSGPK